MHKPSVGIMASIAALMMPQNGFGQFERDLDRGHKSYLFKFPAKWYRPSKNRYTPISSRIKNPKIAAQVSAMHENWLTEQFPSRVTKRDPDPQSVTSIKWRLRCHRAVARTHIMVKKRQQEATLAV